MSSIKEKIYNYCVDFVSKKQQLIAQIMSENQQSLTSETKSSAGDKHETGRAMVQLEMEKASQQLQEVQQMQLILERVILDQHSKNVCLGSLVKTSVANYYIAIGAGKFTFEGVDYFCISPSAPMAKLLLGKKVGEAFQFQQKEIKITDLF